MCEWLCVHAVRPAQKSWISKLPPWAHSQCKEESTWSRWSFLFSQGHPTQDLVLECTIQRNSCPQCHAHTQSTWVLREQPSWKTWIIASCLIVNLEKVFVGASGRMEKLLEWWYAEMVVPWMMRISFLTTCRSIKVPDVWWHVENFWSLAVIL